MWTDATINATLESQECDDILHVSSNFSRNGYVITPRSDFVNDLRAISVRQLNDWI